MPSGVYVTNSLNRFAIGAWPEVSATAINRMARFVSPTVTVPGAIGEYADFGLRAPFQVYDTRRAVGDEKAKRINVEEGVVRFELQPNALAVTVDRHESLKNQSTDASTRNRLVLNRVEVLLANIANSRAYKTITKALTVSAISGPVGTLWGSGTHRDPILDIDNAISTQRLTGIMPNRILFSWSAWLKFKNNTEVLKRFPGSPKNGITQAQMQGLFANPNIEVMISDVSVDLNDLGTAAANMVDIMGNSVLIFHAKDGMNQYDASYMKTLALSDNPVTGVRLERGMRVDEYSVDWEDLDVISGATMATRIDVVS